ncbi:DNA alkylation repair protein [Arthrobacter sp. B2a2-09]|uniref:DNA alkylation repair protein n=1 Tax=Arthrobacter sp. B2a2-09 TaxID=2952822 RepID=UPI0022CDAE1A|nr:DNA alkylation repair protein [Arthrobacter sp. B2a2-09]MCZ9883641.1 DNA alkylation repair protein [Arthrobacter sp. B2a2-09]
MSDAAGFIDEALRRESSWIRADEAQTRLGGGLLYYGSSVGAVRGTVRDALRRHPGLAHDEVTALSSELWEAPVFERRLAAIVLLQSNVHLLTNTDLTRLEGFVREARLRELVDPLAVDVIGPLIAGLQRQPRARADGVLDRWAQEPDEWLRRAALMSPLRALRNGRGDGGGDWDAFIRHATVALDASRETGGDAAVVRDAVSSVLDEVAKRRPELQFPGVSSSGRGCCSGT